MAPSAAIIEQESASSMIHRPTVASLIKTRALLDNNTAAESEMIRSINSGTSKRSYAAIDMNFYAHELVPVGLGAAAVFSTTTAVVIVDDEEEEEGSLVSSNSRTGKRMKSSGNGSPLLCPRLWHPNEDVSKGAGVAVMSSMSHFQHSPKQPPRVQCSDYSSANDEDSSDDDDDGE